LWIQCLILSRENLSSPFFAQKKLQHPIFSPAEEKQKLHFCDHFFAEEKQRFNIKTYFRKFTKKRKKTLQPQGNLNFLKLPANVQVLFR